MKFGKYAVIDTVKHAFEKEPNWWWKIKAPTSGDDFEMNKFLFQGRSIVDIDGVRREFPATSVEVAYREIALTFAGTNIPAEEDKPFEDGGAPILKEGASVEEIEAILRKMPQEMIEELWFAIGDAVPGWGAQRPKAKKS